MAQQTLASVSDWFLKDITTQYNETVRRLHAIPQTRWTTRQIATMTYTAGRAVTGNAAAQVIQMHHKYFALDRLLHELIQQ